MVVDLLTNRTERLDPGTVLETDRGLLTVVTSRAQQGRWIVRFDGIEGNEGAEALRGLVLRAEPIDDPDALWVHDLLGKPVVDQRGTVVGKVDAVQANPASDLLVLDTGGLVPLRFVTSCDAERVMVDVPDGLLDLS